MWSIKVAVTIAFVVIGTIETKSAGSRLNLKLCWKNQTIAMQIATQSDGGLGSCQCQTGLVEDPWRKEDYVHYPGIGSYKIHTEAKNWNDARKICESESGHLAIINSKDEEAILVSMLKGAEFSIRGGLNREEALLGIHDLYKEGEWVTIFGESLHSTGYSSWSPTYWGGQPDNHSGNQNCGAVITVSGMDDVNCNDKFAFICELPLLCY